eukprot:CAMPEP_0197027256 /NCGR_PEP_ID=MMETSP1384-20130603/7211_1 /TAXON_ID=29189 /ORGANISM="Ammonia sp." /LENGTH=178 /DNA_ID=CAMNT_0042456079 /DNA_START=1 /DNA_END=537 /DNA_ORIENTATION=+
MATTTGWSNISSTEQDDGDNQAEDNSNASVYVMYTVVATSVFVVLCIFVGICAKMYCFRRNAEQTNKEEIVQRVAAEIAVNEVPGAVQEEEKHIELVAMESNAIDMQEEDEEGGADRGNSEELYVDVAVANRVVSMEGAIRRANTEELYRQSTAVDADKPTETGTTTGTDTGETRKEI